MSQPYNYTPKNDKDKIIDDVKNHLGFKNNNTEVLSEQELDKDLLKKLDESDPHHKAKMFNMIQRDPPEPDFMKVSCYKGKDEYGNDIVLTKSVTLEDGKDRWIEVDPFFEFSPYDGFKADIAAAPLWVISQLLDEKEKVEFEDKKAHTPEKRKDKKEILYIIIFILCIVGSVAAGAFLLFG